MRTNDHRWLGSTLVLVLGLLLMPPTRGAPAAEVPRDALPPAPRRPAPSPLDDLMLSMRARRTLLEDRDLAPHNVGVQVKNGKPFIRKPKRKIRAPLRMIWRRMAASSSPRARRLSSDRQVVTPAMNRKNGKMRSVGVQPCHAACSSGG